jgi:hypothetical protein
MDFSGNKILLMNKRLLLFALVSFILLVMAAVYSIQTASHPEVEDVNLIHRQIETPLKFWLNGYLGHFFNFKFLTNINWLLIPLFLYAFFILKFFDAPWKKALLVAYGFSLLLVCVKGYFNSRYQLTLFPISIAALFIFLSLFLDKNQLHAHKVKIFIGLLILVLANDIISYVFLRRGNNASVLTYKPRGVVGNLITSIQHFPEKLREYEHKEQSTPYPVVAFIRTLPQESKFLVNNLPLLYYYTNKTGVFYWCGDDTWFAEKGKRRLMENRSHEEMMRFVKDSLGCDYLLSTPNYNKYDAYFDEFTKKYCKPVFLDVGEFAVYQIVETPGNYEIDSLAQALNMKLKLRQTPYYVSTISFESHGETE